MVFSRRIYCHFCGDKSPYTKESRITEFQCKGCEAFNYLDENGDITDTPASIVAQSDRNAPPPSQSFSQSFSFSRPETPVQPSAAAFCKTCEQNQMIYLEALGNYLPDEDHPEYQKFEDELPKFKAGLQRRYPQICTTCAPAAQTAINRADYNARTHDIGRLCNDTVARRGRGNARRRDDWSKRSMRWMLKLVGIVTLTCLLMQIAWHAYTMWNISINTGKTMTDEIDSDEIVFEPMSGSWGQEAKSRHLRPSSDGALSRWVKYSLFTTLSLIWFNPGLKEWYHHTYRMEIIAGQGEYFWMQCILLAARSIAWLKLSDQKVTVNLTTQQLLASHGFMIGLVVVVYLISNRAIKPVIWRHRFKLTPKFDEKDILGASAGLFEDEGSPPQASSVPPYQLFARDRDVPFPIANLAPAQRRGKALSVVSISDGPPSPPRTDSDDGEAMEIDWEASSQSQTRSKASRQGVANRSMHNYENTLPSGWGAMRNETFQIQNDVLTNDELMRKKEEEKSKLRYQPPVEQNPFRGRLPQAPMSMERKLRNPPSQFSFKKTPLSKQQDFMAQMRNTIQGGTTFGQKSSIGESQPQRRIYDENDAEMSPAKARTRGQLDLKQSTWHLPGDAAAATGLEDLFGGNSFSLGDGALGIPVVDTLESEDSGNHSTTMKLVAGLVAPILLGFTLYYATDMRRAVCMYLYHKLTEWGV